MGKWVGSLIGRNARLEAGVIRYRWVQPPGAAQQDGAGWHLKSGDRFYTGDVDGDGVPEILVHSPNGEWFGVLGHEGEGFAALWIGYDWLRFPSGGGWNLGAGDWFCTADVDGNGRDEIISVSGNGQWIGLLGYNGSAVTAKWLGYDWVRPPGQSGGWNLGQGDRFYPADIDGDGRDELVVVSGSGEWIGVIGENSGGLALRWIKHDWVNHAGGSGNSGWNLRVGDAFFVADYDGDGRDELIVVSPDGQWIGVLEGADGGLAAGWIKHEWVNHAGGSGASGWHLRQGDQILVANLGGGSGEELVVLSPDREWIGVLSADGGGLAAGWIGHDWVNTPGGSGSDGWNLRAGDKFVVVDIDDDGRDEIVVTSPDGTWIGILEARGAELRAVWIGHDWVNAAGGAGSTGWHLRAGDTLVGTRGRLMTTSPWGTRPVVRLHAKILTAPNVALATMLDEMTGVYASRGISVEVASRENLSLADLNDLDVGACTTGNTTAEQNQLFANRNFVGGNEIVAYFVNSTTPVLNGCAAHPNNRPGAVVASIATRYTLAHEVGHVLGLNHVDDNDRLMTGNGTSNITNPPPDLTAGEGDTMKGSPYTIDL